ncbi:hypothetical protein WJX74_003687 [Apatococcus lobatus]|uniref:Uncharacterized protein n=1 Tax=Apatococcus lobatus TaxID=904363 RepID=A0AAW1SG52_9CHLO
MTGPEATGLQTFADSGTAFFLHNLRQVSSSPAASDPRPSLSSWQQSQVLLAEALLCSDHPALGSSHLAWDACHQKLCAPPVVSL